MIAITQSPQGGSYAVELWFPSLCLPPVPPHQWLEQGLEGEASSVGISSPSQATGLCCSPIGGCPAPASRWGDLSVKSWEGMWQHAPVTAWGGSSVALVGMVP